jgi:hypothetical protein
MEDGYLPLRCQAGTDLIICIMGYKVVINEPRPYLRFSTHRVTYAKYKGNNGRQVIIRNSNDPKYYVVKGHPKYKWWWK